MAAYRVPVVLDTDIGTDVDDLLALLLLATAPEVDLVAVTTVYGDTDLRARLAARVLRLLGRDDVPVHAGTSQPRSGREVWWAGHEGGDLTGLADERVDPVGGVDALATAAARHPGELAVVAIGPLTNLGEALARDPGWGERLGRLVVMGGEFVEADPEHNVRSDILAAQQVLAAGLPATFVGLDVTTATWFDERDLAAVTVAGGELAALVERQVGDWWAHIGQPRCHPHDPLAALSLLAPELFGFERGGWRVVAGGERAGALERDDTAPPVAHAATVDVENAQRDIVGRLVRAVTGAGAVSDPT